MCGISEYNTTDNPQPTHCMAKYHLGIQDFGVLNPRVGERRIETEILLLHFLLEIESGNFSCMTVSCDALMVSLPPKYSNKIPFYSLEIRTFHLSNDGIQDHKIDQNFPDQGISRNVGISFEICS